MVAGLDQVKTKLLEQQRKWASSTLEATDDDILDDTVVKDTQDLIPKGSGNKQIIHASTCIIVDRCRTCTFKELQQIP